ASESSNSCIDNNNNEAQETKKNQSDLENNESGEVPNLEDDGILLDVSETGILSDVSETEMEFEYQESENNLDDDKLAEIIVDLSYSDDAEAFKVAQAIERYIQIINKPIATEGLLEDNEIIAMVQAEENDQQQESDDDDEEPPPPPVTTTKIHNAIKTVLRYEEQINSESNLELEELEFLQKI
ncbi:3141_t:CDS:2, partial [Dentiscutata erythropus]